MRFKAQLGECVLDYIAHTSRLGANAAEIITALHTKVIVADADTMLEVVQDLLHGGELYMDCELGFFTMH